MEITKKEKEVYLFFFLLLLWFYGRFFWCIYVTNTMEISSQLHCSPLTGEEIVT
jgi:hypothetical protein